ncbi:HAD family hydrolase [Nocardioides sp. S5]|uniref:HAD-IA family hydrolase n=1 Tax=Nocardioides sp. S5 TaxID=2017486 RepID=UPI001A8F958B|nr:HAD-IA family hydrolase [Nocardioides sp. S5]QSR29369.1 HAD family hydrolase [Nocardioides sp. S5]
MTGPALVLDFGGPVLLTPFELVRDEVGTPAWSLLHERGPLATAERPDPVWESLQAGRITERDYWDERAAEWHQSGGHGPDIRSMIAHLYEPARPALVRERARTLVRDAHAAGMQVGILSNDLGHFHKDEWIEQIEIVGDVDVVVDGSVEGYLKPHPRLYEMLSERLDVAFADMVFLDDQTTNIRGAEALGIPSVWFDVTDPDESFAAVRHLLGLPTEDNDG